MPKYSKMRNEMALMIFVTIAAMLLVLLVFSRRSTIQYYHDRFYEQMHGVFDDSDFADKLESAENVDAVGALVMSRAGELGIDNATRKFYVLDKYAQPLFSPTQLPNMVHATTNLLTAVTQNEGNYSFIGDSYIDFALPVGGKYILYVIDDKTEIWKRSNDDLIVTAKAAVVAFGVVMSLCFIFTHYLMIPIRDFVKSIQEMTSGKFPEPIQNKRRDETRLMTDKFNEMVDALRHTEENRNTFIANVSHELKTPITSIRSYAETLADAMNDLDPETRNNFINVILNESDRMTKIVQDLLTLSKMDAGEITLKIEPFNLSESVQRVYDSVLLNAQKRGMNMALNLSSGTQILHGDKARIEQVLLNILSNALRYTPDGGKIELKTYFDKKRSEMVICVKDTGIGIPAEDLPKLFDRFYRVDKARSRAKGGSGLGLAIAKELIERHGGTITIESKLNVGTTVFVRLPS